MNAITGGDKLMAELNRISSSIASAGPSPSVRIGFLEGRAYEDGTSVAYIAAIQEFGATITHPPGSVTLFRKVANAGTHFLRNGRFVKQSQANFSSTHARVGYTSRIPPRPFFRNMIREKAKTWPEAMAKFFMANSFDIAKTLKDMGELIEGQLKESIVALTSPALAASTIRAKARGGAKRVLGVYGPGKPLIASGEMLRAVDYEVST